MKNKIILHIPHSSLVLPKVFCLQAKKLDRNKLKIFNYQMTDLYTYDLFSGINFCCVKSNISRIVCDMEKFVDDKKENMSKYGLGVVYTKNIYGENIFDSINNFVCYKQKILDKYYFPYHKKLDKKVMNSIKRNKKIIFVDCHSFSKEIALDCANKDDLPDICIGFDKSQYYSPKLVNILKVFFEKLGYSVKLNYPYQGVMIPNCLYNSNNPQFLAVMIEINRRLYLNCYKKSTLFKLLKKQIYRLFKELQKLNLIC